MATYDLHQLKAELAAAGIVVSALGASSTEVYTYDASGTRIALPPGAAAIVAAHVPVPPVTAYLGSLTVGAKVRTTDATPTEIFRRTLSTLTWYEAEFRLRGIDAGNGVGRRIRADIVAERINGGALLIGTDVIANRQTPAGAAATASNVANWAINASVSGNDFIITVTGAAGRTIDWMLSGAIDRFSPGGLQD